MPFSPFHAQNRCENDQSRAPSRQWKEGKLRDTSTGRISKSKTLATPSPRVRGEVIRDRPRNASAPELSRHCEEPTGPARSGRPDDRLRDEAIQKGLAEPGFLPKQPNRRTGLLRFARNDDLAKTKGRRSADRRNCPVPRRANRCRPLFALRARARYRRARLPALRRGTCGGERTPPLSFSPHFLGPGVIRCYLHLTCPFSPASCPAVPVVVPDGRIRRSRPSAECKSARGNRTRPVFRCASRTRPFKWASYCLVTDAETTVNRKVTRTLTSQVLSVSRGICQ